MIAGRGSQVLSAGSPDVATCSTNSLAAGTRHIFATYSGNANFIGNTGGNHLLVAN